MSHLRTNPGNNIRADATRTLPTIGEIHHFIHVGAVFDLSSKFTLPANSEVYFIGVPNGGSVHFHKEQYTGSTGGFEVRLYEGVAFTGGTPAEGKNRNRKVNKPSAFELYTAPDAVDVSEAEELYLIGVPATNQPAFRAPSTGAETDEWILKEETPYAIEFTNLTSSPITMYVEFSWYETALLK